MKVDLTHDEMQIIKSALNNTEFVDEDHDTIKDRLWVKFANAIAEDLKLAPITYTNDEYLDLHGSKENAYLKPRISSNEYFKLPEDKRRFYMRFCGHNEVYYTLNPAIRI